MVVYLHYDLIILGLVSGLLLLKKHLIISHFLLVISIDIYIYQIIAIYLLVQLDNIFKIKFYLYKNQTVRFNVIIHVYLLM